MKENIMELHCPRCGNSINTPFSIFLFFPCHNCGETTRKGRRFIRVDTFKPCRLKYKNIEADAVIMDISYGGAGVLSKISFSQEKDELISVEIPELFSRQARMVWTKVFHGITLAGFVFLESRDVMLPQELNTAICCPINDK